MRSLTNAAIQLGVVVLTQLATANGSASAELEKRSSSGSEQRIDLEAASTWGYQLQSIEPTVLAATPYDVIVIDFADNEGEPFTPAELDLLKHKADGERRIVLSYLSIGEAEDYRFYWNTKWGAKPPAWLGEENPDWPGNYSVHYWDRDWQGLIFGGPGAYVDRIISAGFDGVYLDRVDAFDMPDPEQNRPARMATMSRFVESISSYARSTSPEFVIVVQNGEELLTNDAYRASIDGLGKEDLFFGIDGDGIPNAKADIRASLGPIEQLTAAGKPTFLVEYLTDPKQIDLVRRNATQLGMPLFIADRELDHAQSR